jgi:DNA-binding response OmpR family regulator
MHQTVMAVCCSSCRSLFRITRPTEPQGSTPKASGEFLPRILIAHESPAFCEAVRGILGAEPWEVAVCHDGVAALELLRNCDVAVALLDVALPGRYGFEICETLRSNPRTAGVKVLLFASIYDRTRYKRQPNTLYGADDYLEKHHIPDLLLGKVRKLLAPEDDASAPAVAVDGRLPELVDQQMTQEAVDTTRALLKREEETETISSPAATTTVPETHIKARRLSRIIASDIALYNQEAVEEGVRSGTFFTLLADDIAEGRALYQQRVAEEIRSATNYLEDAFSDLIAKVRKELNL